MSKKPPLLNGTNEQNNNKVCNISFALSILSDQGSKMQGKVGQAIKITCKTNVCFSVCQ